MVQKSEFIELIEKWNENKRLILMVPNSPIKYVVHTIDIVNIEPNELYDKVVKEFTSLVQEFGYSTDNVVMKLIIKPTDTYIFGKELECDKSKRKVLYGLRRR